MNKVSLRSYKSLERFSASKAKKIIWYFINFIFFKTMIPFPSKLKILILKLFGCIITNSVVIKPNINIKYPWLLEVGENVWIGESVWIDNLAKVIIKDNVCISQGAYLLTGSHNYKKASFDLILGEIVLENGVWIGAKSIVCPNVICKEHSILSVASVATNNLEPYTIYQGNPAIEKRKRNIE